MPFVALGIKNRGSKRDRVANFARALQLDQLQVVKRCKNANTIGAAVVGNVTASDAFGIETKKGPFFFPFFASFSLPLFSFSRPS